MNKQEIFDAVLDNIFILTDKRIGKDIFVAINNGEFNYKVDNYTEEDLSKLKDIIYSQAIIYQEYIDEIIGNFDKLYSGDSYD